MLEWSRPASAEHLQTWRKPRTDGPGGPTEQVPEEFRQRAGQLVLDSHRSVRDVAGATGSLGCPTLRPRAILRSASRRSCWGRVAESGRTWMARVQPLGGSSVAALLDLPLGLDSGSAMRTTSCSPRPRAGLRNWNGGDLPW